MKQTKKAIQMWKKGEFRIKIARRHKFVLDYTSDEFFTSKKRGQPFGKLQKD